MRHILCYRVQHNTLLPPDVRQDSHLSTSLYVPCLTWLGTAESVFFLLLLSSQLYLWGSPFFLFFCVPSYISGVHHSSSSAFPSYISRLHRSFSSSAFPAISLGFTILLLLLLHYQLYLWGSSFSFLVPSYISGVHHSPSSAFPAISLGFTILLHISGVHHSSSSAFPAISLGVTILLLLLRTQLYLWGLPFFVFFCVPSYISGLYHSSSSSSSSVFPTISLGIAIFSEIFFAYPTIEVLTFRLLGRCTLEVFLLPDSPV